MTSARTSAALLTGRRSVRNPATLLRTAFYWRRKAPMCWKTGLASRSFSFPRQRDLADLYSGTRSRNCPQPRTSLNARLAATRQVALGQPCRGQFPIRTARTPGVVRLRSGSREDLLECCFAASACDQDAAVSDRPRGRGADPGLPRETRVAVPQRPLKRVRQLITTSPPLDINKLIPLQAAERDRRDPPTLAGTTRERNHRDHRTTPLKLTPYGLNADQLAAAGMQPRHMRPGGLST